MMLKFGTNATLKKLSNPSLSLKRGSRRLQSWLRGLRLIEADTKVFEKNDSKQQWASTTGQGITRMLACNEEILNEQRSLSRQTPVLDLFKSCAGNRASPPELLDIDDDDPNDQLSSKDNECDEDMPFLRQYHYKLERPCYPSLFQFSTARVV